MKFITKIKKALAQAKTDNTKSEERLPMQVAVPQEKQEVAKSVLEIFCPYCASQNYVKRGTRQKKRERVQLYLCNDCQRTFTPGAVKGKHYPTATILDAISLYNLGYSLDKTCKIVNKMIENVKGMEKIIKTPYQNKFGAEQKSAKISGSSQTKNPAKEQDFEDSSGTGTRVAVDDLNISHEQNMSRVKIVDNFLASLRQTSNALDLEGVEPSEPRRQLGDSLPSRPKADKLYHKNSKPQSVSVLQPSSLANWLKQYQNLCPYSRMRPFGMKMYAPEQVIDSATLAHRQLYRFRYHKAKTQLIIQEDFKHNKLLPLKEFLDLVPAECPHEYFQESLRASEAPIFFSKSDMIVRSKQNYANKLAKFVLESVKEPKERHDALQRFMLANDSVTVATEVPVYLRREDLAHMQTQLGFELYHKNTETLKHKNTETKKLDLKLFDIKDLPKLITGHIDMVQIRNGAAHILDYKPKAAKERPLEQLTLYALALSRLTGLRVFHFKCAWFDEKDYFEFYPLHVVYKKRKNKRRTKIQTMEGKYKLNQRPEKMENLRPMA